MAGRNFSLRVAMYSHDTFGLGHITRTLRLARATVEAIPNASVLLLTGSPIAHRLTFPQGVEYVKLPSVRKRGPETYVPRELGIPFWRLRQMRVRILRDALRLFRPHIFFVDNVPLGMKGEILPSLEDLKKHGTALHLNLRDILDEPGIVRSQWAEDGTHDVLNSLYDEVHVFGDRSIHDSAAEYGLPACKTLFHGYIAPPEPAARERVLPTRRRNGLPSVLITIGGGEDGAGILRCALEAERRLDAVRRLKFDLVLGPLMGVEEAEVIRTTARGRGGVSACEFVEDLADFMPEYDLVVSMGGYNTLCEVMTRAQRSLVIPRIHPRREQELRARALEARGILTLIHPGELTPERFGTALAESLERGPVLPSPRAPRLEGVGCFKRRLEEIAPSFRDPAPRRQKRPEQLVAGVDTRRRGLVRSVLGLGIVGFLACSAGFARADLRPKAVNAEMLVGYDTNVLDASDAEIMAFETHDPGSFFVVEHMKDAALQMSIDGRWALAAGSKTDARLRYTRLQYLRETIRSENHYSLQWRSRASTNTLIDFSLAFAPNVYARHRRDKDALPGDPVFRAEVRNEWDSALQIARALGPHWSSVSVMEGSIRDYRRPFDERDRWRGGGRTGFAWRPSGSAKLDLSGGYRQLRSRNVPYLGSDLSYKEWSVLSAFDCALLGDFLRARAYVNRDWTRYTSTDPGDESHFGRHDNEWEFGGSLQHALSPSIDWKAGVTHMRRYADSALALTADLDEEGSVHDTFVSTGIAWHWQP
ncbi:MAG: hypothetical protein E6K74_04795 [Candidatus Eisenbacteria bacterium]|uniref:Glycosyl transferase family 28 C-terminal domain-containing protein n=1 Tax=Eiseniibacteriota bacterium TaxID=2212470 RepID=A0A538SU54_UNCEI|nr:MAG: hypothetical protein E6K74_04795 [Candidatus Eisenbacteria bacterium]